jgi:hypothetical protein
MEFKHCDKKLKQLTLYLHGLPSSLIINDEASNILLAARETASGSVMDIEINNGIDVSVPQLWDFQVIPLPKVHCSMLEQEQPQQGRRCQWSQVFEVPDIQF